MCKKKKNIDENSYKYQEPTELISWHNSHLELNK
jgi:hypothetical protein